MLNRDPECCVDLAGLGFDFAFESRRHFLQNFAIDLDPGLLHAGQNLDQRQIDFFIKLQQPGALDVTAQSGGEPSSNVGRFRQRAAQFEVEPAQRHLGQRCEE